MYRRSYLRKVLRAMTEGYPVKGYFLWSLIENFEWIAGYSRRQEHLVRKQGCRTHGGTVLCQ